MFNRIKKRDTRERFAKQSYSQCGEDLILEHLLHHLKMEVVSYLDIGAHHPFHMSNTALLYGQGVRGVNVEPDPKLFGEFKIYRDQDINLNVGVSDVSGTAPFYMMSDPALNTFSIEEAHSYEKTGYKITATIEIEVMQIRDIVSRFCDGCFPEILSLDVESLDEKIIKSLDLSEPNDSPKIICLETVVHCGSGVFDKNSALIEYVENCGYRVYGDTFVNTLFVRDSYLG